MTQYLDYLRGRADESTYLDDGGLGDWETFGKLTRTQLCNSSLSPASR